MAEPEVGDSRIEVANGGWVLLTWNGHRWESVVGGVGPPPADYAARFRKEIEKVGH